MLEILEVVVSQRECLNVMSRVASRLEWWCLGYKSNWKKSVLNLPWIDCMSFVKSSRDARDSIVDNLVGGLFVGLIQPEYLI
jgi:hypothetical protein